MANLISIIGVCGRCGGTKVIPNPDPNGSGTVPCDACHGTGESSMWKIDATNIMTDLSVLQGAVDTVIDNQKTILDNQKTAQDYLAKILEVVENIGGIKPISIKPE
jgi:DnaJ-class molecular chaperone